MRLRLKTEVHLVDLIPGVTLPLAWKGDNATSAPKSNDDAAARGLDLELLVDDEYEDHEVHSNLGDLSVGVEIELP